MSKISCNY